MSEGTCIGEEGSGKRGLGEKVMEWLPINSCPREPWIIVTTLHPKYSNIDSTRVELA